MNLDKKKKKSFPKLLILEEHKWTAVKIHGVSKRLFLLENTFFPANT